MTIRQRLNFAAVTLGLSASAFAAGGSSIELVSSPFESSPSSFGDSAEIELNADGNWAVFTSSGNGIVTNDANGFILDVFLRNLETGETTLLSGNNRTNDALSNGHSYGPTISADSRFVLFESEADNLLSGDDNESTDIFLYDRSLAALSALSRTTNGFIQGASGAATMTPDARFILFETDANGLMPQDNNFSVDLYLLERDTGKFSLASARSFGAGPAGLAFPSSTIGTYEASLSGDGRFVAFVSSGTNHYPGVPMTAGPQIYLRDMVAQTNAWLTRSTNGSGALFVANPIASSNSAFVVFLSSNILPGSPVSSANDMVLFVYNIPSGVTRRIPSPPLSAVDEFVVSENGKFIAFGSSNQVFIHDLAAGTNRLASITPGGGAASGFSSSPAISADGRFVLFTSNATNLVSGSFPGDISQVYRFDQQTGEVVLLSRAVAGDGADGANADILFPVISRDGSTSAFMSYASNLVAKDNPLGNDVYVVSTSGTAPVILVSAPDPFSVSSTPAGESYIEGQAVSLDGRFVIFSSIAPNIVTNDSNAARDIFVRDLQSGVIRLVSAQPDGTPLPGFSTLVGASLDGSIIAFESTEMVSGTNRRSLFIHHRSTGSNTLASILPSGPAPTTGEALLSADGRYLAFREAASTSPLYIRDLEAGTSIEFTAPPGVGTQPVLFSPDNRFLVTRTSSSSYALHEWQSNRYITNIVTSDGFLSNAITADSSTLLVNLRGATTSTPLLTLYSLDATRTNITIATNATALALSADGSTVAYLSRLAPLSNIFNIQFYDVKSGLSSPLTVQGEIPNIRVRHASALSADGRYFAFAATNSFATGPEANSFNDIYVYDRVLGTLQLASGNQAGVESEFGSSSLSFSANGRVLVFDSSAANLIPGDLNLTTDVFVTHLNPVDTDADGLEDGWETIYFGGLNTTAEIDSDNDGLSNRNEFRAGTDPNSGSSKFSVESDIQAESFTLSSPAAPGHGYQLQYRTSLTAGQWQNLGEPTVAFSNTITFEAPLKPQSNAFFRIQALE